jgi:type IV pilus assembly protein PilQ
MVTKRNLLQVAVGVIALLTTVTSFNSSASNLTNVASTPSLQPTQNNSRLSFYFQNIKLRALLQLIAKSSGLNFIISDTVTGDVTLDLKNVTWQQALETILKTYGLMSRQVGNVIYISTLEQITTTEARELQAEEQLAGLTPLSSKIVRLKYTNATDLANLLKGPQSSLLTARGQVAVDSRTNSIIIRDTAKSIYDVTKAIQAIDIPAKQVLIEARIVNIDTTYEEQIGVRFGMSDTRHLSGTLSGANQLAGGTNVANVTPYLQRLNFNVPANNLTVDGAAPGSVALALARLGSVLLDLELSALEGEKHAKLIAQPRIITSNQQKAHIQTGEEIPYQESTSSGATSVSFKNAVLSLEITPQITPDNKIILNIKATEDSRGESIEISSQSSTGGATIPAINTQEVQSNILLNDNETIAIGGVYKIDKENSVDRIPFFGSLPLVGNLFSHHGVLNKKSELLVFITPKIIKSNKNQAYKGEG